LNFHLVIYATLGTARLFPEIWVEGSRTSLGRARPGQFGDNL
jgi:hypothetical protein